MAVATVVHLVAFVVVCVADASFFGFDRRILDTTRCRPAGTAASFCAGTGLTTPTSAPGVGLTLLHLHREWGSPLPHLHRD
jgi:hypothetical protein